jgi:NAD(P)-dependent dehydrogenase (short-subunit alcohol dehydrogenase family)
MQKGLRVPANEKNGKPIAVVIGGGSGIGDATCLLLAEKGWQVVVCDINLEAAQNVAKNCNGHAHQIDVCDAANVENAAGEIEKKYGPVMGVAMCAAIFQVNRPVEETPMDEWDKIVAVCLRGTYLVDVAFGKRMAQRGRGAIVNLSSFNSQRPAPMHAYCSAKAGVEALTGGMAGEWGRSNVRVNTVTPGTTLVPRVVERIRTGTRYAVPLDTLTALGRLPQPREVGQAIAFLLSNDASAITGANIVVDAGMMVAPSWAQFGGVRPPRNPAAVQA